MSFDVLGDLNWPAVLVAGLAYFALGGLWYSPVLFGNQWMKAAGISMPEDGARPGPGIYIAPLITNLVAAIALGMIATALGSDGVGNGIVLGLVVGLGFAATVIAVTAVFDSGKPQPANWAVLTGGYHVVGLLLVAVIVSIWR